VISGRAKTVKIKYNSKTPTTIQVVNNILLNGRLRRDYNQLLINF
jgi:hypothetical protein